MQVKETTDTAHAPLQMTEGAVCTRSDFHLMQVVSKVNAFEKHLGEGRIPGLRLQRL